MRFHVATGTPVNERPTGAPAALRRGAVALAALIIGAATLRPVRDITFTAPASCIICGTRGVSDFILNVALFFPLGAALIWAGILGHRALLMGALGSCLIEGAQLVIPGRDASLGDLIANTLGCGLGVLAVKHAGRAYEWTEQHARIVPLACSGLSVLILMATGLLLAPTYPESTYFGQWTPDLAHLERYRGRVVSAAIGQFPVADGSATDHERIRDLLTAGRAIGVSGVAGARTSRLASLFSIHDDQQREILLIGPDRDDLVYRYRTRATLWRLDQPDHRAREALAGITDGDSIMVRVSGMPGQGCLRINAIEDCDLGFTVGVGWALLLYPEHATETLHWLLGVAWLAGLTLPIGLTANRQRQLISPCTLVAAALAGAPYLTVMAPTTAAEWSWATLGIFVGVVVRSHWLTPALKRGGR